MPYGTEKNRMVWLPDGEKKFEDMFIRFDTIHERDGHTHTDTHTPHSIASRGKSASIFEEHRTVCLLAPVDCILQATTSTNDYALLQLYGRLHSADYAVARCLSVCLSACLSQVGIITKRLNMASNVSPSDSHTILVFFKHQTLWQYSDETP